MYEEPIKLIETQMRTEIENEIFRAIKEVGVDVNKEELEKALRYDRRQYSKGYKDGYEDGMTALAERLKEKMTLDGGGLSHGHFKWGKFRDYEIDNLVKEKLGGDTDE